MKHMAKHCVKKNIATNVLTSIRGGQFTTGRRRGKGHLLKGDKALKNLTGEKIRAVFEEEKKKARARNRKGKGFLL